MIYVVDVILWKPATHSCLLQGKDFQPKLTARQTPVVKSHTVSPTLPSRKRKAASTAKAVPSPNSTNTGPSSSAGNQRDHDNRVLQQHRLDRLKPASKRQKEPLSATQTHSMQSMPGPAGHVQTNDPPASLLGAAAGTHPKLLPLPSTSQTFKVGGLPHTHHVQHTMHQLSRTLTPSHAQLPNSSEGSSHESSKTADVANPGLDTVTSQIPTRGLTACTAQQQQQHAALQPQPVQTASPPGHQPHLVSSSRSQQQIPPEPVHIMFPKQEQLQGRGHHATAADASTSHGVSHVADSADVANRGLDQQPSAKGRALSQLIARAKKLKEQLDAHALQTAARW